jgi:hypothetical protein
MLAGWRCRYCSSRRGAYILLPHHEWRGWVDHRPWCRARWDMIARGVVELDFTEYLDRRGVHTAHYGGDRPAHRFPQQV